MPALACPLLVRPPTPSATTRLQRALQSLPARSRTFFPCAHAPSPPIDMHRPISRPWTLRSPIRKIHCNYG
ncbi:hypothetical protein DA2_1905 [Desulfovibrio sp. A2]|nr:hypothetical protein DA2_1905 [Desulfovibrio sp. A2]